MKTAILIADGDTRLIFSCPGCGDNHGPRVDGPVNGKPRWIWNGDMQLPTLSPSVMTRNGAAVCHLFLKDGQIEFLGDCTHALAGQTVPLGECNW